MAGTADAIPHWGTVFLLVSFRDSTYRALCQGGVANKIADTLVWALFPVYFRARHLSLVQIGWITGLYAMVWGVSQLWTGHLADRIGRKPPIVAGFALLALGIAVTAAVGSVVWWFAAAAVMGVGMALLYPNLIAAMADLAPPLWRGRALGTYRYWRDTGYAIGALLLGAGAGRLGRGRGAGDVGHRGAGRAVRAMDRPRGRGEPAAGAGGEADCVKPGRSSPLGLPRRAGAGAGRATGRRCPVRRPRLVRHMARPMKGSPR